MYFIYNLCFFYHFNSTKEVLNQFNINIRNYCITSIQIMGAFQSKNKDYTNQILVATLNYGGILNSPFEFYSDK